MVEGGTKLLQSFIDEGIWDEARIIVNSELSIVNGIEAPHLKDEALLSEETISNNIISYYSKSNPDDWAGFLLHYWKAICCRV